MNINDAIKTFESQGHNKFSPADKKKIIAVVEEHGFSDFEVTSQFITDVSDALHIHSTMIVSGNPYAESFDRGPDPYPKYPHFYKLTGWTDQSHGANETVGTIGCPECHRPVPKTGECECGWKPAKA